MGARELLTHLEATGVHISFDGDAIRCERASRVMTDDLRQAIREHKEELIELLKSETPANSESLSYIKRCETCGGTHWGCIRAEPEMLHSGALVDKEVWGCLDCAPAPADTCHQCSGQNIVTDAAGRYCVDCRQRIEGNPLTIADSDIREPRPIGARWARSRGYIAMTNPVTGERIDVVAKGLPGWVYDRLNQHRGGDAKTRRPKIEEGDHA